MRLFGRTCAVTVGDLRVTGLRMAFKTTKTLKREPNTLDLVVTNLSAEVRRALQTADVLVTLEAGYEGASQVLFIGNARRIIHVRSGPDWETRVQCGDGEKAIRDSRVNEAMGPGTSLAQAVGKVAETLGASLGNAIEALRDGSFGQAFGGFANGIALTGPSATQLDRLLATAGYTWSIQDGALQLVKVDEPTAAQAVVLSEESGLVGSPEFGEDGIVSAKSLLQPDLRPGRRVLLRSASMEGLFRVEAVTHSGDTAGADWYSSVELGRL